MADNVEYSLSVDGNQLRLITTSFKADKGSVLHSGVYNREMATTFVAVGVSALFLVCAAFFPSGVVTFRLVHYLIAALLFMIAFPLVRIYVFKESLLETVIDRDLGVAQIIHKWPLGQRTVKKSLDSIVDVQMDVVRIEPQNPDGVAFVEKIALQHGTVIPGFGQTEVFFTVNLVFSDNVTMVFSSVERKTSERLSEKLKVFIQK